MRVDDGFGFKRVRIYPCACNAVDCPGFRILLRHWQHWGNSVDELTVYDPLGRPWTQKFFNPSVYPALRP